MRAALLEQEGQKQLAECMAVDVAVGPEGVEVYGLVDSQSPSAIQQECLGLTTLED